MGFRFSGVVQAKKVLRRSLSGSSQKSSADAPKGYFAVYGGENQRRFDTPIACLSHQSFQELLSQAEDEYGFEPPTGCLTILYCEDTFIELTSQLN